MRIPRNLVVVTLGTIVFLFMGVSSTQAHTTPCGVAQGNTPWPGTDGLWLVEGGSAMFHDWTVYDENLGVCWLSDANLAGDPAVVKMLMPYLKACNKDSVPTINPDGTMDYPTAQVWVCALNAYGWLNQHHWQLPATQPVDSTCSSFDVGNFGIQCKGSALSNLYYVGLRQLYPNSVEPSRITVVFPLVAPFFGLQPGLYWTSDMNNGGQATFSFNTGQTFGNTTEYNLFHVLPMTQDCLGGLPSNIDVVCGTPSNGAAMVVPYVSGDGAGKAVYDTKTGISWPWYANLAAFNNFGVTTPTSGTSTTTGLPVNGATVTVPAVDDYGHVYFPFVDTWIAAINSKTYAGSSNWTLPHEADLQTLHDDLGLTPGDARFEDPVIPIPFFTLQPGFYWACVNNPNDAPESCDKSLNAPQQGQTMMEYSFNFDDGFLGTDQYDKQFYVMVYYIPAP
jgi:hypothetical protein